MEVPRTLDTDDVYCIQLKKGSSVATDKVMTCSPMGQFYPYSWAAPNAYATGPEDSWWLRRIEGTYRATRYWGVNANPAQQLTVSIWLHHFNNYNYGVSVSSLTPPARVVTVPPITFFFDNTSLSPWGDGEIYPRPLNTTKNHELELLYSQTIDLGGYTGGSSGQPNETVKELTWSWDLLVPFRVRHVTRMWYEFGLDDYFGDKILYVTVQSSDADGNTQTTDCLNMVTTWTKTPGQLPYIGPMVQGGLRPSSKR